jgi:hypothetical protein
LLVVVALHVEIGLAVAVLVVIDVQLQENHLAVVLLLKQN